MIYIFPLFTISFANYSRGFNKSFLYLDFHSSSICGSSSGSNFGSKFFIGNNLILRFLRTFSLAVKNNPMLLNINTNTFCYISAPMWNNTEDLGQELFFKKSIFLSASINCISRMIPWEKLNIQSQRTIQRRINFVSTLCINVKITLFRRWK